MVTSTVLSRITAILIFSCLLIFAAYPVLAKDATTPATLRKEKVMEKIETRKEKMASREAALKAKLEKFKDKKKAEVADRVNTNLNEINQKQTEQMLKHLDKMSALLTKLGSSGSSISDAKTAIASASAAARAQAEKDYTITITAESAVKKDAQKVRDALHTDLRNVRKQVIAAKQAVANAIRTVRSKGESNGQ